MCVQVKNNLPKCYLHKDILLIGVLYKKIKKKQACRNAMPMLFVWKMTRTVKLLGVLTRTVKIPSLFISGHWSQKWKKSSHMWLAKPAILQSDKKKKKYVCDDKNCQSTKYAKYVCNDKNCQSNQCVYMQLAMKSSYMWSVTKPKHMWLPKAAMKQSTYKKLNQDDRNCQSTKPMCYVKPEEIQSSYMQ